MDNMQKETKNKIIMLIVAIAIIFVLAKLVVLAMQSFVDSAMFEIEKLVLLEDGIDPLDALARVRNAMDQVSTYLNIIKVTWLLAAMVVVALIVVFAFSIRRDAIDKYSILPERAIGQDVGLPNYEQCRACGKIARFKINNIPTCGNAECLPPVAERKDNIGQSFINKN